jgi:23S rRNA (uracil1939-C5)-methyltransferase
VPDARATPDAAGDLGHARRGQTPSLGGARLARGAVVEATIEKLVYGGDGLARVGAHVLFVPLSAPGDVLRIRVTDVGRGFARGTITEIVKPGPARRDPRCRHFGACGGCQLQHVTYEAQLGAKAAFVRESLARLGRIEWTADIPVRAAGEYRYRSRAELQARRGHVGFFRTGTHEIVDVTECPILVPEAEARIASLREHPPRKEFHLAAGDDGAVVMERGATVRQRIAGFDFEFAADSFFQGNRLLVEALVEEAVGGAAGDVAVDLYAGAGLFSLPLSRTFRQVVAVESWRAAAKQGDANAARNGVENVRFCAEPVEDWLARTTATRPDLVVLDPPRTGAGHVVVEAIARLAPPAVTYVSCDPATLARDLRLFVALGYTLTSVVALDLFPQTFHVETVAKLVLSGSTPATTG